MFVGVKGKLRQLDIYRKLPTDLTEATTVGALISIISTIFMITLFITELKEYIEINNSSEMFIDRTRGDKIQINIDIILTRMPCDIVSVDIQDIMGSHTVNVGGQLLKKRYKDGHIIQEEVVHKSQEIDHSNPNSHNHNANLDHQRVIQAYKDNEGCQLVGNVVVNKVPGNFHISAHAYGHLIGSIFQALGIRTLDLSHQINHLSFGDQKNIIKIQKKFKQGSLTPLDGSQKIGVQSDSHEGILYQYYLSVVPTTYVDDSNKEYHVHQFTSNSNEVPTHHMPALFFKFELNPMTVRFIQWRETFIHFLIQICAIVGGVYAVASFLDKLVHKSVVSILQKHQQGKLT